MKIICIGRNYNDHIAELNNAVPDAPVIFMKPQTALLKNNDPFFHPSFTNDIHYECEVVYRICKAGKHIQEKFASKYYDAFTLGIDFTARDVQENQKQKGLPWEIAKAFDGSAVIGNFIPLTDEDKKQNITFQFYQNNELKQNGDTALCINSIDKIIAYVSQFFTLQAGDLIFTGTPKGVGKINIGDELKATIGANEILKTSIK